MRNTCCRLMPALAAPMIAFLVSGCHTRSVSDFVKITTPMPPAFLVGPAAVFLTNTTGFSAQVQSQTGEQNPDPGTRGQLLGSGAKLLFAPVRDKALDKRAHAGNFLFIWDVSTGRGYVVSEALQGYAPIASDVHATNLVLQGVQTLGGLPQVATVQMNNGTAENFQIVRSADLKGFPLRILSVSKEVVPLTATFSKVKIEPVAAELFNPPEGFAKYDSPEAMVDELAARQRNLRRRQSNDVDDLQRLLQQRQ